MVKNQRIVVTRLGGPDCLRLVDDEVGEPAEGEVRIRVLAAGVSFADLLIREYREHAAASKTETPIAETESSSEDRYVNRYEKATLLLLEARRRFGEEALDRLLKTLHTRYAGTREATTELLLEAAEEQLGVDAKAFFSAALFQKSWSDPKDLP